MDGYWIGYFDRMWFMVLLLLKVWRLFITFLANDSFSPQSCSGRQLSWKRAEAAAAAGMASASRASASASRAQNSVAAALLALSLAQAEPWAMDFSYSFKR